VEDHEDLRTYATSVLRDVGYRVLEARNGAMALDTVDRERVIDLIFVDVVLPDGMDGRQLAEQAARRKPGIKVLYTTGYAHNAIVHNGRLDPGVHLLTKPFSSDALLAKVRQVIDG
jgi:CheY-like chemotaxis protein